MMIILKYILNMWYLVLKFKILYGIDNLYKLMVFKYFLEENRNFLL